MSTPRLPKFPGILGRYLSSSRYGETTSRETTYVPDMNEVFLSQIPALVKRGEKGVKIRHIFSCTLFKIREKYGGLLEENKELITQAMRNGYLELYASKPGVEDPYEFALGDGKHLFLTKHPNLKQGEVVSLTSNKRIGRMYKEDWKKSMENSIRLDADDLFPQRSLFDVPGFG